jgi:protoporphyrinogen oxidase
MSDQYDVVITGGGFTGLAAAFEASKRGLSVCVIEPESNPGGLGGTFEFTDGVQVEKFYHHWFNNDVHVPALVKELGLTGEIISLRSKTGMYFNRRLWRLSTPLDLLRFTALPFWDRVRLGLLILKVRGVKDWRSIEHLSIPEWLVPLVGERAYRIVWEPLVASKFSIYADVVNAVWMWKKLVLRGSTRNSSGAEELAYFKGGFGRLAEAIVAAIEANGGVVLYGERVTGLITEGKEIAAVTTDGASGLVSGRQFLFTPALPIIADIFKGCAEEDWLASLRRVRYLGNMCLVLRLKHSLSETYWLNVNDPGFPFVGVIEHTNFDAPENYAGSRIVYLSRYLATADPVWAFGTDEYLAFAVEHLKRMFPEFDDSWVIESRMWRAEYAQPITERGYSDYVPSTQTPFNNALIATMAQVYPEDRGTNYAIRDGRSAGAVLVDRVRGSASND